MSPYKLITGTDKNIAEFEEQIAKALLAGYDLANDLVVQLKTNTNGETETVLYQAMISDESLDLEDDDDADEFEDEEEIDEYEEEDALNLR